MSAIISAKGITKSYGALPVLKGIDLEIQKAEVISIVGASGAGKTTLLQILGTLDTPDEGELSYEGQRIDKYRSRELARFRNTHVGFIFQFHHLLPEFTALENVCIPAYIANVKQDDAEKKAKELLDLLGLSDRITHKPGAMSGGEQQRVAVARSLINSPKVVFADEPSGNLDSKTADDLHNLFFSLRKQMDQTFVIVTHNNELADMADRKLVMRDGKME